MEKKIVVKKAKKEKNASCFLVKTRGYRETFKTLEKAKNQFEILKKRSIKGKSKVKIELFEKEGNNQNLIDEVLITEDFYNED